MIVDCHAHLVPPELLTAIRKDACKFPNVRLIADDGSLALAFAGGKPTRPVSKPLSDIAGRLAWMGEQGIDRQVVGGWVDMFGYELPSAESEAWARLANDALMATAKAEPRFVPLATVPLGDGARAAAVLKDAIKAGFAGAMIGTLPRGVGSTLDAADLDAFWQAADETGAVIHIHPSYDAGDVRVNDFGLANGLGRITDAAVAVARLISAGHVAKYKRAKFFAPMGAAALPFVLGRLKRNAAITPGIGDPVEALSRIYTDTILHDARVLKFVIEMIGGERIMMGSDMPFPIGDRQPWRSSPRRGSLRRRPPRSTVAWRRGCSTSIETGMKLDIGGDEIFEIPTEALWSALNDPAVLKKCIPGCKDMIDEGGDRFKLILNLKVASVGGSFEGEISLADKTPPTQCKVAVSGSGTLGHGSGLATFRLTPQEGGVAMHYGGEGEIGGLVAGVGQRILKGVAKHLIKQFFTALRRETAPAPP